ncbi:MAG: leucine-rich repeat domain-containing protein [Dehalococcoidales bacterium]|nr:leucine-rich repeat domain-containing protein [Dehalococcoidales bacterium]
MLTHTHGFSCLKNLQFLMLADNRIRVVEGLEGLDKLIFLDLSHNLIEVLDTGSADDASVCQLPEGLISLNFRGNPFTQDEDYVEHVVTVSPYLKALDGQRVTNAMRRNFGLEASDDEDDEEDTLAAASSSNAAAASSSSSSAGAQRSAAILAADDDDEEDGDDDDDDDDDGADAADALRAETEEMRKRSQQRTMLYDTKHGVTQATTEQDRKDTLTQIQQEEQAAAAAARSARK